MSRRASGFAGRPRRTEVSASSEGPTGRCGRRQRGAHELRTHFATGHRAADATPAGRLRASPSMRPTRRPPSGRRCRRRLALEVIAASGPRRSRSARTAGRRPVPLQRHDGGRAGPPAVNVGRTSSRADTTLRPGARGTAGAITSIHPRVSGASRRRAGDAACPFEQNPCRIGTRRACRTPAPAGRGHARLQASGSSPAVNACGHPEGWPQEGDNRRAPQSDLHQRVTTIRRASIRPSTSSRAK